ncbi:hypothetical protein DPMN_108186 [Dreissena polymorpha]|uniref:Uncharacterized protein n=1 Tax=Dreissena polymorpha TaxID=45954 RepID=A0A9D4QKN2_DREPO|nr:hypothetical protein DPMN_108186 [Dreissena polymorpha]
MRERLHLSLDENWCAACPRIDHDQLAVRASDLPTSLIRLHHNLSLYVTKFVP